MANGLKPLAFYRIVYKPLKDFIDSCIGHRDRRPTAEELLEHRFFNDEESVDAFKPIEVLDEKTVQARLDMPSFKKVVSVTAKVSEEDHKLIDMDLVISNQDEERNLVQF